MPATIAPVLYLKRSPGWSMRGSAVLDQQHRRHAGDRLGKRSKPTSVNPSLLMPAPAARSACPYDDVSAFDDSSAARGGNFTGAAGPADELRPEEFG
jgi:hypothetical protein